MTPCKDDYNGTLTPFDSIVETANGDTIRVTQRGTVRILLLAIFRPEITIVVKLHKCCMSRDLPKDYCPSSSGTPAMARSTT
jgi:hypothetical protein